MSNSLTRAALSILILLASGSAFAQDSQADRQVAVERYFKAMPFDTMMNEMSEEMAKYLPEEKRSDFKKLIADEVRFDIILAAAKASLAKHLTTDELNAYAAFMESPLGRSATSKMKYYMADVMPVIQAEVARAMEARESAPTEG